LKEAISSKKFGGVKQYIAQRIKKFKGSGGSMMIIVSFGEKPF